MSDLSDLRKNCSYIVDKVIFPSDMPNYVELHLREFGSSQKVVIYRPRNEWLKYHKREGAKR